jgi:hypothetical protein
MAPNTTPWCRFWGAGTGAVQAQIRHSQFQAQSIPDNGGSPLRRTIGVLLLVAGAVLLILAVLGFFVLQASPIVEIVWLVAGAVLLTGGMALYRQE